LTVTFSFLNIEVVVGIVDTAPYRYLTGPVPVIN
jgi:hypothetical protein